MHKTDNPTLPPPAVFNALRRPRRPQLNDPCVKALLAKWKQLGRPIEYGDLWAVAALLGFDRSRENIVILGRPDAKTRRKIVATVEAAGIKIRNFDEERRGNAKRRQFVSLSARGVVRRIEEQMWRWPEEWDNRPPRPPMQEYVKEWHLKCEYGPTLEEFRHQERFRQEKFPWFDGRVLVKRPTHVDALRPEEVKPGDVVHKPLQLPEDQEEKGSGIRVLVRRGPEEHVLPAEELHTGDVIVAWPAPDPAEEARQERERRDEGVWRDLRAQRPAARGELRRALQPERVDGLVDTGAPQQRKAKTLAEKKAAAIAGPINKPLHRTLSRESHIKWVRESVARERALTGTQQMRPVAHAGTRSPPAAKEIEKAIRDRIKKLTAEDEHE